MRGTAQRSGYGPGMNRCEEEVEEMEFKDALAFLQENHSSVVTTIGKTGLPQATIVRAGPYDGKTSGIG